MDVPGPPRRFFLLPPRKRRKGSKTTLLTLDAVRLSLELVNDSADACPALKSAVGAVVALCNLADRVAASSEDAKALAWRAVTILDIIYQSVDANNEIPSHLLHSIVQFEQLVIEIQTAMEATIKKKRVLRVLHLRRNEAQLAKFTAQLDSAAEAFTIGNITVQTMSLACIEDKILALARIEDKVESISAVASAVEHSNILLHDEIKYLRLTVVFLA